MRNRQPCFQGCGRASQLQIVNNHDFPMSSIAHAGCVPELQVDRGCVRLPPASVKMATLQKRYRLPSHLFVFNTVSCMFLKSFDSFFFVKIFFTQLTKHCSFFMETKHANRIRRKLQHNA